jgi:hypothetical protein
VEQGEFSHLFEEVRNRKPRLRTKASRGDMEPRRIETPEPEGFDGLSEFYD